MKKILIVLTYLLPTKLQFWILNKYFIEEMDHIIDKYVHLPELRDHLRKSRNQQMK